MKFAFAAPLLVMAFLGACATNPKQKESGLKDAAPLYKTLAWDQLSDADLGQTRIVCGPVAAAVGPGEIHDKAGLGATLGSLVVGGEPTNDLMALAKDTHRFKVVVPIYDATFPKNPSEYYRGKDVCVIAPVMLALVGGYEMLPTHGSQIAIKGETLPVEPRAKVKSLPAGALSYEQAKEHWGETKTVCGVVQTIWANMAPARAFPPQFALPPEVKAHLPKDFELSKDERLTHEMHVGDRVSFTVWVVADAVKGVTQDPVGYYRGKDVCVSGALKPSIFNGASLVVDDPKNIWVLN